jgi:hypothetical protein
MRKAPTESCFISSKTFGCVKYVESNFTSDRLAGSLFAHACPPVTATESSLRHSVLAGASDSATSVEFISILMRRNAVRSV